MGVTSAWGITAPVESFTVPEILPPTPAQHRGANRAVNEAIRSRIFVPRRSAQHDCMITVCDRAAPDDVVSNLIARLPLRNETVLDSFMNFLVRIRRSGGKRAIIFQMQP